MAIAQPPQSQAPSERSWAPYLFSLWLLVLLRRELGIRLLHPGRLFVACCLMVGGPLALNLFYQQPLDVLVLCVFAGLVFLKGLAHRAWHARELASGTSTVHTMETGESLLASRLPRLPLWLAVCVDPAACFVAGYLITLISSPVGVFVMLSAGALLLIECRAHLEVRRQFLNANDALRESERYAVMAEHHAGKPQARQAPSTFGTPAGVGDDIEWHLSRRRD